MTEEEDRVKALLLNYEFAMYVDLILLRKAIYEITKKTNIKGRKLCQRNYLIKKFQINPTIKKVQKIIKAYRLD